jgi:uncharacterized membrane protein YhhN
VTAIVLTVLSGVSALCTVAAVAWNRPRLRIAGKCVASAAFVALGWALADYSSTASALIVAGLAFSAVGDLLLLGQRRTLFATGIAAFAAAHLAYMAAALGVSDGVQSWWGLLAPIPVSAAVLAYVWPHLGRLRWAVTGYIAIITAMLAVALGYAGVPALFRGGAALFYVSDFFVARQRFVTSSIANRAIGLPAYYGGQLLIAWSLSSP